jgi:hypothetical protein
VAVLRLRCRPSHERSWWGHLLYFLKRIVGTKSAPGAFLAGQIIDGLATPVVGFLSDRTHTRYGEKNYDDRSEETVVCGRIHSVSDRLLSHVSEYQKTIS